MQLRDLSARFAGESEACGEYLRLAILINDLYSDGREKTIAIERLEESLMWIRKALIENDHDDMEDVYGGY